MDLGLCVDLNSEPCFWKGEGVYYPLEDHNALLNTLRDRRHRFEAAEARIRVLEARIAVLTEEAELWNLRLQNAETRAEIAKESQPGFWETRIGWCVSAGGYWDPTDTEYGVGLTVGYGFRF